jgi:hypothetical protein
MKNQHKHIKVRQTAAKIKPLQNIKLVEQRSQ